MVNSYKPLTFSVKHSILDVWQGSEYTFVICHSFFRKIEDANKIRSVAMITTYHIITTCVLHDYCIITTYFV